MYFLSFSFLFERNFLSFSLNMHAYYKTYMFLINNNHNLFVRDLFTLKASHPSPWLCSLRILTPHQANVANWKDSAMRKRNFHRDEFLHCTSCRKERRFRLKNRPDIKNYHEALNNKSWTCSLWPYQK